MNRKLYDNLSVVALDVQDIVPGVCERCKCTPGSIVRIYIVHLAQTILWNITNAFSSYSDGSRLPPFDLYFPHFELAFSLSGDMFLSTLRWLRQSAAGLEGQKYDVPLHTSHEHRCFEAFKTDEC